MTSESGGRDVDNGLLHLSRVHSRHFERVERGPGRKGGRGGGVRERGQRKEEGENVEGTSKEREMWQSKQKRRGR